MKNFTIIIINYQQLNGKCEKIEKSHENYDNIIIYYYIFYYIVKYEVQ